MKNSCLSEASYLGKPENYTLIMHIMTCFEVPINLFGVYCILFKTPKKMESVKWPLLILQVLSSIDDFGVSYLGIPYIYFPFFAGFPLGVTNSPMLEVFSLIIMVGVIAAAILSVFENRFFILFGQNTCWGKVRIPYLIFNFLLTPIGWLPVYLTIPEQEYALKVIKERMPCIPDSSRGLTVLTVDDTLFIYMSTFLVTALTLQNLIFCGILLLKMVRRNTSTLSRNTLDLQKKFLFALTLQVIFPITVLVLPIAYYITSYSLHYYNQSMNNLLFCFVGSHGFLSTLIMVFVHQPYRKVTLYPINQLIPRKPTLAVISSTGPINN